MKWDKRRRKFMYNPMNEIISYSFLEWNIQGAGGLSGYTIQKFVADTIIQKNKDIVVLVEFYIGYNFDYIRQRLQNKYFVFISPFLYGHNQVLIALNRSKFEESNILKIVTANPLDIKRPEYLQLDIKTKQKKVFSIIGARIKTQGSEEDRVEQFKFLNEQIESIDRVICVGDFNLTSTHTKKYLTAAEVYGPRTLDDKRWSFVHKDYGKVGIDLVVAKNIEIPKEMEDDLSKENYKMYAIYDWGFVNAKNGYKNLTSSDYLPFTSMPNHAILIGNFKININR